MSRAGVSNSNGSVDQTKNCKLFAGCNTQNKVNVQDNTLKIQYKKLSND